MTFRFAALAALLAGSICATAQAPACYTLESIQGQFGIVSSYQGYIAIALGVRNHDANGNMTANFIINQPKTGSTTGERLVQNGTNRATYTINCDGTGVVNRVVTVNGAPATSIDDFIITEAVVVDGKLIATKMEDAQRAASTVVPGGVFSGRKYYRRYGAGCFTQESLQGNYAVEVSYDAYIGLGMQPEILDGKGNLTRSGVLNQPVAGSTTGARTFGTVTSTGTYSINCEGFGTINRVVTRPDGTKAIATDDFMVLESVQLPDGRLQATTIVDAQREPSVVLPGGVFVTRVHKLRPTQATPGTTPPPSAAKTAAVAGPQNRTETARSISLDGTQSTSADGKPLTFNWTVAAGSPIAVLLGANTATPSVQFAQGRGVYTFTLTVTDSTGATATDTVSIDYRGL